MISQQVFQREPHLLVTENEQLSENTVLLFWLKPPIIDGAPAPTAYNSKSDFDKTAPHARAFSFGIAREAYSKVYLKESPPVDTSIPGPGAYII